MWPSWANPNVKVQCIKLPNVRVYLIICLNPSKSIDRNPWLYFWGDTVLEAQFLETHTPMDSAKPYPQLCLCFLNKISIYRRFHQLKHLQIPPKKMCFVKLHRLMVLVFCGLWAAAVAISNF